MKKDENVVSQTVKGKLKLLLILNLTFFLSLGFMQVSATVYSQSTRFNFDVKNKQIADVLREIEHNSEFRFLYQREQVDVDKKVSLEVSDETVEEILNILFAEQKVVFDVRQDNFILIKPLDVNNNDSENSIQQQRTVSGTVTDSNGQPLPGVTIVIKGTTQGTITSADGSYTISNVPEDATLVFSFVGMKTQEIEVEGRSNISTELEEESIGLEEVIAVGYRTKNISELSSSVSVVNEEKLQAGRTSINLGTMLQGKVPGLVVSNTSGHPQRGTNVVIRGVGSIGAGYNPLYVVDGVIGGTYNPSDIESITVLKDAAATGLYGSRAANGVILITTKSGKSGKTVVNYNSSVGPTFHRRGNLHMMNSQELYDNRRQAAMNNYDDRIAAGHPDFVGRSFDEYFNVLVPPSVLETDSDWPSLLTRRGYVNKQNISVSGGNEKTTFYISGNYFKELGTLINEKYQEFNLRTNIDHEISDKFNLSWKMNANTDKYPNDWQTGQSSTTVQYYINVPWDPVYEEDGITPYNPYESGFWYGNAKANHFYDKEHFTDITKNFSFNTDLKLQWDIADFISFSTTNRFGIGGSDWRQLLDDKHIEASFEKGRFSSDFTYSYSLLTSNLLSLNKSFGFHNISGLLGQEYSYSKWQNTEAVGTDIPQGLYALSATGSPKSVGGNETETGFKSYFSLVDYNYRSRYFLTASVRTDASSRFGANNRWGTFYSIGGSWNISNEDFLSDISWMDLLKIKSSYGSTGNANISNYLHLATYSFATRNTYVGQSGTRPARLPNPDLTWEKAYTTNVGIEYGLENVVKLEIDLYNRENRALLQSVPLSAAAGFSSQERNVGTVRNKGIDFNLTTVNVNRALRWETNLNFNINRNKILSLHNSNDIADGDMRLREGLPMRYWYMRKWVGVDVQTGDPIWLRWEDAEGNVIHGADKKEPAKVLEVNDFNEASNLFIESAYPDFTGGISNDFFYKNFSLGIYCNFIYGNSILFSQRQHIDDDGKVLSKNQMNLYKDWVRWEEPGDIATHPRLVLGGNKQSAEISSRYLEDGSYFKINNIRLGYTFPYVFSGLTITASIDEVAVFSKFSGNDPDLNIEDPESGQSAFSEAYGGPRRYLLGINVNF